MPRKKHPQADNAPVVEAGDILWLNPPPSEKSKSTSTQMKRAKDIFDHPVMVWAIEDPERLCVLILSSLGGKNLVDYTQKRNIRAAHLPIHPSPPHPDTGEILVLRNNLQLDSKTYVKTHTRYSVPINMVNLNYCDPRTKAKYKLGKASLAKVRAAVDTSKPSIDAMTLATSMADTFPQPLLKPTEPNIPISQDQRLFPNALRPHEPKLPLQPTTQSRSTPGPKTWRSTYPTHTYTREQQLYAAEQRRLLILNANSQTRPPDPPRPSTSNYLILLSLSALGFLYYKRIDPISLINRFAKSAWLFSIRKIKDSYKWIDPVGTGKYLLKTSWSSFVQASKMLYKWIDPIGLFKRLLGYLWRCVATTMKIYYSWMKATFNLAIGHQTQESTSWKLLLSSIKSMKMWGDTTFNHLKNILHTTIIPTLSWPTAQLNSGAQFAFQHLKNLQETHQLNRKLWEVCQAMWDGARHLGPA